MSSKHECGLLKHGVAAYRSGYIYANTQTPGGADIAAAQLGHRESRQTRNPERETATAQAGGPGRHRTCDLRVMSTLLCH
jgi:hypothetical protein